MNIESLPSPEPSKEELRAMPYAQFLETDYWRKIARMVKDRDGRRCVVCNSTKNLAAHHRTYEHHGEEHLFLGDLTTLCEKCHTRHHFPPPPTPIRPQMAQVVPFIPKSERRFFRRAAIKMGIKAKKLRSLGVEKVREMLATGERAYSPPKVTRKRLVVGDPATVDADMPDGDPITLSRLTLNKCRANGAFTSATIKAFGLDWKTMGKGWAEKLIGNTYPREQIYRAMMGRHFYSRSTRHSRNHGEGKLTALLEAAFPSNPPP